MLHSDVKLTSLQSSYLDFVRGLAAMAVLFGHAALFFLADSGYTERDFQSLGVYAFFFLSGFLICYSVFRKFYDPDYSFKTFFIDRFCRIYCAFVPALVFVAAIDYFSIDLLSNIPAERMDSIGWLHNIEKDYSIQSWIGNLFMLQDYPLFQIARVAGIPENSFFIRSFGSDNPFWTISIEWWIYMAFGITTLIYIRARTLPKLWHLPFLGFIFFEPYYHFVGGPDQCLTMLWGIGGLACFFFLKRPDLFYSSAPNHRLFFAGLFILSVLLMFSRLVMLWMDDVHQPLEFQFASYMGLALFSLLFALRTDWSLPRIIRKIIWFIAEYSYSLYLVHYPLIVFLYLKYPGHDNDSAFFWMAVLLSNIVAIVFWFLFERHHRTIGTWLKNRLVKSS